jgi:hypothetical protein
MKRRIRIIDGLPYELVDESVAAKGKYRQELRFWRRIDGRVWALIENEPTSAKSDELAK